MAYVGAALLGYRDGQVYAGSGDLALGAAVQLSNAATILGRAGSAATVRTAP